MSEKEKKNYAEFLEKSDEEKKLLLAELKQDCSFVFKPNQIGSPERRLFSYKWMLSAVSPVFHAMFNGNFDESTVSSMDIKLDDISFEAFELFLNFVYYGTKNVDQWPECYCLELFYIADKYIMPEMLNVLHKSICPRASNITVFKSCEICKTSRRVDFKEDTLTDSRLGEFDLDTFIEFMNFLRSSYCGLEDDKKFKLIEAYILQKGYNVGETQPHVTVTVNQDPLIEKSSYEVVQYLFSLVKFDSMQLRDFLKGPGVSELLPIERKYALLRKIILHHIQ